MGASLAGIADGDTLHAVVDDRPERVRWPRDARSAIVLARAHPAAEPLLDRWDCGPGRTPGNRLLAETAASLVHWLKRRYRIAAILLPYQIVDGGVFAKDAAVLAGLGVIGRNNLVVTPAYGPRVRLVVVLTATRLVPTSPVAAFTPCDRCPAPCLDACPQGALAGDRYDRRRCMRQMACDEAHPVTDQTGGIQYCRACELACPVGG